MLMTSRFTHKLRRRQGRSAPSGGTRLVICLILFLAVLTCKLLYPRSMDSVRDLLMGQEGGRFQRGVSALTAALDDREGLPDAVEAFWQGLHSAAPS